MKYRITWVFRPYSINSSNRIVYDDWSEALLYETGIHSDAYALINAKLTLNSQDEAKFSFVMPPSHEHYDRIEARVGYIIFWQDDEIICKGRIDSITGELNGAKNISGFGNLGLLKEALISQSSRKWFDMYHKNSYEAATRTSMFTAFKKSDGVREKVQRILDIANGQLCDYDLTSYNPDLDPSPTDPTRPARNWYTEIQLGICSAQENVNGININNTNSSGGAQEGVYINAKYETFDTAFEWFKSELISKTECQIECSFIPLAGDSAPKPPYAMTLNIFGRDGMQRTTAVFRSGWNILDYQISTNRGDDFYTVLLPLGEEDSRMSSSTENIDEKTGYEETVDSKMTLEADKVENVFLAQGFPTVVVDDSLISSLQVELPNDPKYPAHVMVLFNRLWKYTGGSLDDNKTLSIVGEETPAVYLGLDDTWSAKLAAMNEFRVYKVWGDSDKEPAFVPTPGTEHTIVIPTWPSDHVDAYKNDYGEEWDQPSAPSPTYYHKEHWDRLSDQEMANHVRVYWYPDAPTEEDPTPTDTHTPVPVTIANGMTFAIRPPYIIWIEGLAKYGPIVHKEDFSTKSRVAILNYGIDAMRKSIANSYELTVRAIDPHLIDPNYASARVASRVPIMIPEYEGEMVICTKTIDISQPGNCLIEFNKKPAYLVDIVKENVAMIKRAYAAKRYTRVLNGELVPQENGSYNYDPAT